jgi:hypothetical protein
LTQAGLVEQFIVELSFKDSLAHGKSYVRDGRFKLTNGGELYDVSDAPYKEILVPKETTDSAAVTARENLRRILLQHPAAPAPEKAATRQDPQGSEGLAGRANKTLKPDTAN